MKAVLHDDLVALLAYETESDLKAFVRELDQKFGVISLYLFGNTESKVTIPVQKICLDETDMNELFHDYLHLFEYSIEYSALGGKGCDFAICVKSK